MSKPNYYCDKCECGFHFELPKQMGEMKPGELPRCPYCGSFNTRPIGER